MRKTNLQQRTRAGVSALIVAAMLAGSTAVSAQEANDGSDQSANAAQQSSEESEEIAPYYGNINPFYGNISPFWGNISPFYGNISPFWGNISPFYGNISPFWGNIDPFTASNNALAPSWGNIEPFWNEVGAHWTTTNDIWSSALNQTTYQTVATRLKELESKSADVWGAAVQDATGQSFAAGFADPLYAKYGIDPNDPSSLAGLDEAERAQFFMDWYDGLMNLSGHDRVDHWMQTANWTPAITQQQGSGADTVIGVIDASVQGDEDLMDNVISRSGYNSHVHGHGIGVASLMVAAHDGEGVMGIAPNAKVALHNPFDHNGAARWMDVRNGIQALKVRDASVINMSLGIPGVTLSESWNDVFGHESVKHHKWDTLYVLAAGNDGVTQTSDIEWGNSFGTNFLVVGSVDPSGNISSFSNRPGDACLLNNGVCRENLMDRFLVAPGELILVSDGQGGTTRLTGTSFAAPIVSGAVALLHDRWQWLAHHPDASAEIILRSAKDLGEPGVDSVYGHGLLDVLASQAPLDFNQTYFFETQNGQYTYRSQASLQANGVDSSWEANGVYFTLFEYVGNTYRDFAIPMSTQLSGSMTTIFGTQEQYQSFLTQRLTDYIENGSNGQFTDVYSYTTPDRGGWQMSVAAGNPTAYLSGSSRDMPHSAIRAAAPGSRIGFTAGHGHGAMAISGQRGFGLSTDYASDGGVNPLLGLASGGSFFATDVAVGAKTKVSFGFTDREVSVVDNPAFDQLQRASLLGQEDYSASAMNLRVEHQASENVNLSVNYTRLREDNALLAVQAGNNMLDEGSRSETLTLTGTADLPGKITLAASATAGRSETAGSGQQLATTDGGVLSSAFALSATKNGIVGGNDRLRLSVSQPLHIERGEMVFTSAEIVDRDTGALGVVEHRFDIGTSKRLVTGEILYAAPISDGQGEVSFFGRATVGDETDSRTGAVAGARLKIDF